MTVEACHGLVRKAVLAGPGHPAGAGISLAVRRHQYLASARSDAALIENLLLVRTTFA